MSGDREAYPLFGKLLDPNWPFLYSLPHARRPRLSIMIGTGVEHQGRLAR